MASLIKRISTLYDKEISATGLGIFRIVYGIVLLVEVWQLFYFRHLVFDRIPYLQESEMAWGPALFVWMIFIILLIFGLFTRLSTIVNYIFTLLTFSTFTTFEYHYDFTLTAVNFILLFVPLSRGLSLDNLIKKLKFSTLRVDYKPKETVSVLAYYAILLFGVGMVYFDSIFHKSVTKMWTGGTGVWLPASNPSMTWLNLQLLLDVKWLMYGLSYLTLALEAAFIFLFFRRRFRLPVFVIGFGLHLGIFFAFPIPLFAFGYISIYLLLIPIAFWRWLGRKLTYKQPAVSFFYDELCPLCNRTRIILKHIDLVGAIGFKGVQTYAAQTPALASIKTEALLEDIHSVDRKGRVRSGVDTYIAVFSHIWFLVPLALVMRLPGIYQLCKNIYNYIARNRYREICNEDTCGFEFPIATKDIDTYKLTKTISVRNIKVALIATGLILAVIFEIGSIGLSPLAKMAGNRTSPRAMSFIMPVCRGMISFSRVVCGIYPHGVFVDKHFTHYNHDLELVYIDKNGREAWLPLVGKSGLASMGSPGRVWALWAFRANNANINQLQLENGVEKYTAFWAYKNNVDLKNARFMLLIKKIDTPHGWEKGFLTRQLKHPWLDGGEVTWTNYKFQAFIKNIESI